MGAEIENTASRELKHRARADELRRGSATPRSGTMVRGGDHSTSIMSRNFVAHGRARVDESSPAAGALLRPILGTEQKYRL